jgi:hypothetical protein
MESIKLEEFKKLGTDIGLVMHGIDPDSFTGAMDAFDVESENPFIASNAVEFYKSAAAAAATNELEVAGYTQDYVLLKKLAACEDWDRSMADMLDLYLADYLQVPAPDDTVKSASLVGVVPGAVAKGVQYTPTLMKSLLALGVMGGAATGGLYWGANRHMNEDSLSENENLRTKIREYDRIRRMIEQDIANNKVRSSQDLKRFARSY